MYIGNPGLSEIIPYRQKRFIMNVRIIIAVGLLLVSSVHAETTIPQTIEELWADFPAKDHRGRMLKAKGKGSGTTPIPSDVSGWDSSYYHSTDDAYATDNVEETTHKVDHFRNLRWEGGEYIPRPKHYEED